MKNWMTSLFGSLAAACTTAALLETPYKAYFAVGAAVFGAVFAFVSKDNNVTGN